MVNKRIRQLFSSQPTVCSLLLIVLQTWGGGLGRSIYKVGTLLTYLSHQIHFSSLSSRVYPHPTQTYTSLQDLLLLWIHTCPVISFLITLFLLSFRTAPEQQQSSYNSNSDSFLLLNGTLDCLLPLLKWAIYLFPSPPSHLIYISPRLGLIVSNFICSVTLALFTSSVLLILCHWHQWPKWSFIASRQEPRRNSSPKWCNKLEKGMLTHSNIHTYFSCLQTLRLEIRPHFSRSNILHAYGVRLTIHNHNEMQSSYCMYFQSKETATDAEFTASSALFIWSQGESTRDTTIALIKNMQELLRFWGQKSFPEEKDLQCC